MRGSVVRSLCGRDKKRIFMILEECRDGSLCVMIADGKLHPLSKPKKKNLSHLAVLATAETDTTSILSHDSSLKAYLESFEEKMQEKIKSC